MTLSSVYLHGFASSPSSSKARYLGGALRQHGPVVVPELNLDLLGDILPSFTDLTVSRMLEATRQAVADRIAWERAGTWPVYHYSLAREVPLAFGFYQEVVTLPAYPDASRVPTLILHGLGDTVVPPRISQTYQERHPETRLELLDTDHQMADALPLVLERIESFIRERNL